MSLTLSNQSRRTIGSLVPEELLPPLGLLSIGGPLIDAGHYLCFLNADIAPMTRPAIIADLLRKRPDAILIRHPGFTSAHPTVVAMARLIRVKPCQTSPLST